VENGRFPFYYLTRGSQKESPFGTIRNLRTGSATNGEKADASLRSTPEIDGVYPRHNLTGKEIGGGRTGVKKGGFFHVNQKDRDGKRGNKGEKSVMRRQIGNPEFMFPRGEKSKGTGGNGGGKTEGKAGKGRNQENLKRPDA